MKCFMRCTWSLAVIRHSLIPRLMCSTNKGIWLISNVRDVEIKLMINTRHSSRMFLLHTFILTSYTTYHNQSRLIQMTRLIHRHLAMQHLVLQIQMFHQCIVLLTVARTAKRTVKKVSQMGEIYRFMQIEYIHYLWIRHKNLDISMYIHFFEQALQPARL
jgi:hypothetical protein